MVPHLIFSFFEFVVFIKIFVSPLNIEIKFQKHFSLLKELLYLIGNISNSYKFFHSFIDVFNEC